MASLNAAGLCTDCARWEARKLARTNCQENALSQASKGKATVQKGADVSLQGEASESALVASQDHTPDIDPMLALQRAVAAVAAEYGYTPADLNGPSRVAGLVHLRQGIWRALFAAGWGVEQIGEAFGGRCHTTVVYGIQQSNDDISAAERIASGYVGIAPPLPGLAPGPKLSPADLEAWIERHHGTVDLRQLAERWGMRHSSVGRRLREAGLVVVSPGLYSTPAAQRRLGEGES